MENTSNEESVAPCYATYSYEPKQSTFSRTFWLMIAFILSFFFVATYCIANEYLSQLEMQKNYLRPVQIVAKN